MKLLRARVTNYQSIEDSGWFELNNVTCLVGKNEAGKTAILKALMKLNPAPGEDGDFDFLHEYPRRAYSRYKKEHKERPATVVQVEAELADEEIAELEETFGKGILKSKTVTLDKNYANNLNLTVEVNETVAVKHLVENSELPSPLREKLAKLATIKELTEAVEGVDAKKKAPAVDDFLAELKKMFETSLRQQIINRVYKWFPIFVYFDQYGVMGGRISIPELQKRVREQNTDEADRTFLFLLDFLGIELNDLETEEDFERLKAEMEAGASGISSEVFKFWSQNKQLRVQFDMDTKQKRLDIRVWNDRHSASVLFDRRSAGFVWFFSFLAYFNKYEDEHEKDIVLLLDEPGLSLHGKAQGDFLTFINERLAPKHGVIYTTHSPFMVEPDALDRVRTVQDVDGKGTIVSKDILLNDRDTIFPLQAALGYEMAQTLFVRPDNLLVEGPSDLIYLQVMGHALYQQGKAGMDPRWTVVPVGGADKLSTFVSLLGANKLNVAVLMDISAKAQHRLQELEKNALLKKGNLIHVGEFTGGKNADIEDVFSSKFYLELVNAAFGKNLPEKIQLDDLPQPGNTRIVKRLEAHFADKGLCGGHFDHYRPAEFLLGEQAKWIKKLDAKTIDRFSELFKRANLLLPRGGAEMEKAKAGASH